MAHALFTSLVFQTRVHPRHLHSSMICSRGRSPGRTQKSETQPEREHVCRAAQYLQAKSKMSREYFSFTLNNINFQCNFSQVYSNSSKK